MKNVVPWALLIFVIVDGQDGPAEEMIASAGLGAGPIPGQIVVDPDYPAWFKYHDGGPHYMSGPGDPEGFLYRGQRNPDGTRDGDQMELIQKLAKTDANCIYLMAVRSHGGDGGPTENPFIDSDPASPLNENILEQWESWFAAMEANGITIFFFFYDDDTCMNHPLWNTGDDLGDAEQRFIDTIVDRFKHHKRLIWCVKEEYAEGMSRARAERIAERIRLADDRQHPVAVHQWHGTSFDFDGSAHFNQFAMQYNVDTAEELHAGAVAAWNNVQGRVNVNLSEFQNAGTGRELRKKIWAIAMAGAYSMIFRMDIATTPLEDLRACGRLVRFMESTRFNEMSPSDELARGDTDYVLAAPGTAYIVYADSGDRLGLMGLEGTYSSKWFDPLCGNWLDGGIATLQTGEWTFPKPASIGDEAVLYIEACTHAFPAGSARDLVDFGVFQRCFTGAGGEVESACACADADRDGDVDIHDFRQTFVPAPAEGS
ncbi:MAG: hypothetical protein V3W34_20185 [Phycisphaerae bacterium]